MPLDRLHNVQVRHSLARDTVEPFHAKGECFTWVNDKARSVKVVKI